VWCTAVRGLFPLEKPGVISFLAGRPNPDSFPFESLSLHLKAPLDDPGAPGLDLKIEGADMVQALS
jgi:tryptophan aminotransferase